MPLLCYCMIEEGVSVSMADDGILGSPLRLVDVAPVQVLVSEWPIMAEVSELASIERALEFHRVVHALLRQTQLVQLRFPTVVPDEAALRASIAPRAAACGEALRRFRDTVQMEVRLRYPGREAVAPSASGTEYLQNRRAEMRGLEQSAERVREAAGPLAVEWRQRWSSAGLRCYALVQRNCVGGFRRQIEAKLGGVAQARISGPWPPAEFMGDL
jgi:hypothetical protein